MTKPLFLLTKLLSVTALIFVLNISEENLVGATNKFYKSCEASNLKQCGDNQTISFPFFIQGSQDRVCGFPNFQISCNKGNPIVKLSGDDYVINKIFYHNQSLIVSNSAFSSSRQNTNATATCFGSPVKNLSLQDDDRFSLVSSQTRVSLFYNHCLTVGCYELGRRINNHGNCSDYSAIEAPVLDDRTSHIKDALRGGFMLTWTASDCSYCKETKGKCGFDFEKFHFQCFCPDRPHAARCGPPSGVDTRLNLKLGAGLGIPLGVLICFMIGFFVRRHYIRRRNKDMLTRNNSDTSMNADVEMGCVYYGIPLFSYKDLQEATNNFDAQKELGDGGFGTVYHGVLKDGREVAVKRLYEHNDRRVEQFMNEVKILTTLRHHNLVTLYGCTSHRSRDLLLVYEYIPNGTLADHLHGERASSPLDTSWPMRLSVAVETATALAYLHASGTVHRDVKSANILLDATFSVKVADFGLSRLFPSDVTHVSTGPQGTPGYVDPEYHQCYQLTTKSDVYSFGVVLAELLSSMAAVDITRCHHEINLSNLARAKISSRAFEDLVDPRLGAVTAAAIAVADLAFRCLEQDKEMRPTMDEVLAELKRIENGDDAVTEMVEDHEACLLKSGKHEKEEEEPTSPNTVTQNWPSSYSTTPNISTDKVYHKVSSQDIILSVSRDLIS